MKKYYLFLVILPLLFGSCNSFDALGILKGQSPNVEKRFEVSVKHNEQYPIHDIRTTKDDYQIYVFTDLHARTHSDRLDSLVSIVCSDTVVEKFGLCLGDIVNGKDLYDMVWNAFQPLRDHDYKLMHAIGNHDLYFGGWEDYLRYWPTTVYSFCVSTPSAGTDLYVCLDSGDGTLGRSQRAWLENLLANASQNNFRHIIVFTHTHFFKRDSSQETTGNYSTEESTDLYALFSRYGVDYVFSGHDHYYEKTLYKNVCYYTLNSATEVEEHPMIYRFRMDSNLSFVEVPLN